MRVEKIVWFCLLCLVFSACNVNNKHDGYAYNPKHQYYFKLLAFADTYKTAHPGDIVVASIDFSAVDIDADSLVCSTDNEVVVRDEDSLTLSLLLLNAHSGDSLAFIVPTSRFIFDMPEEYDRLLENDELKLSVKVKAVLDSVSFYEHKKELELWLKTKSDYEEILVRQYLAKTKEPFVCQKNGIYKQMIKKGTGDFPEKKDVVMISFQGSLLSGEVIQHFTTFDFALGAEMQVVEGLEQTILSMREGERARVIVPSAMAWGETGTSDGSIAPFTPIIFDVELMKIEK